MTAGPMIQVDAATILALLSATGTLIAVATFISARRKAILEEGQRQQVIEQLRSELAAAKAEIGLLRGCYQETDSELREIKTHILWIKETLAEMRADAEKRGT